MSTEPVAAAPASAATPTPACKRGRPRQMRGVVVSDKMDKTIVVAVTRRYQHPVYKKFISRRVKFKAHDERNEARAGDEVRIVECRPLSREKRWRLREITKRAN